MTPEQAAELIKAVDGCRKRLWWIALWLFLILCFMECANERAGAVHEEIEAVPVAGRS